MNVWRYQTSGHIEINAPIEQVYAAASDPATVPLYAHEIARIDVVKRLSDHIVLVRSHLKVAGLTLAYRYQYHYRPPTHYSGVQERGKVLRGYFKFTFRPRGNRTIVSHTEGVLSLIPGMAWVAGFIYFRVIARGGIGEELGRLKNLVESRSF